MICKMKPLIGITTGEIVNKNEAWSPITYGQSYTYSHHHQAVKDIASVLRASAHSEDDIIEAIEGTETTGYMIGVQCHPESLLEVEPKWNTIQVFCCPIQ